ncbi:MAG: alpha-(1-2)-phosphatidylinositol mannosyltransferase, partial [Pseudonocardiaceae bacterium]
MVRVGLVCPYSLTLPGGVQGQVLGLAHTLRRLGIEARVLGPCDGPPPDSNVTPLGNSIPTA